MTSVNKDKKFRGENAVTKYDGKELAETSKFLSSVLRHRPGATGVALGREGWADIDKLVLCAQGIDEWLARVLLDTTVATSNKKRLSHSGDDTRIRAAQGYLTLQVAVDFIEKHHHNLSTTV